MDQDAREHHVFDYIGEITGMECVAIIHEPSLHERTRAPKPYTNIRP